MLRLLRAKETVYLLVFGILLLVFSYLLFKTYPLYKEFFSFLWRIFIPFLIAAFIAYLLYPLILMLHKYNIHKGIAVLFIYIMFFGGIGFLFYRVYPQMIYQMRDFTENFPQFIQMYEDIVYRVYDSTSFLPENIHDKMDEVFIRLEDSLDSLLSKLINGFMHIFDMIIVITTIPVLVFYYIKDHQKFSEFFQRFIPRQKRAKVTSLVQAIDEGLGGYIRGQFLVCLFVSLASIIVFKWLEIPYALLLSFIMGMTNLIPYFGPIIGAVPAVLISYTISGKLVVYVIIAIIGIQILENNFLSPYIVGKNVNIHPVAIIFVLMLGGELFGIIGMILAVPVLTIAKVIISHLPNLYSIR